MREQLAREDVHWEQLRMEQLGGQAARGLWCSPKKNRREGEQSDVGRAKKRSRR